MKNKKYILAICLVLGTLFLKAQDSSIVFSPEQFLSIVRKYHPVMKQYDLLTDKGKNTVLRERGNFDPYLFSNIDQKYFSDKQYYSLWSSGLKIPTWYGLDFKVGLDQSSGQYINAENTLPNSGLVYAGISMPILQGFWINERRNEVKKARIFAQSTQAEQLNSINNLLYDALAVYWEWYNAHRKYAVFEFAVSTAKQRFEAVKSTFSFGDRPAIDTLESYIQYQNRLFSLNQASIEKTNAALQLSNFLWNENEEPLEIQSNLTPINEDKISIKNFALPDSLNIMSAKLAMNHPAVKLYQLKYDYEAIERQWKLEKLKPKLNLNYNLLAQPIGDAWLSSFSTNNYKWGVDFSFPVFLRKERGDLRLADIKLLEINFAQEQKTLEQTNKIEQYKNELTVTEQQNRLFAQLVKNYDALLSAEKRNFESGESSLFLVNAREMALIDAQVKQIEIQAKFNKAKAGLLWAIGVLK
jgi:outer membrane protein TolC